MGKQRSASRSSGFTLAEMAVALVIVGLLLAGALIPISTQMELKNIGDTQRTLDQIRESIVGFVLINGRLPCPADGTLTSASPTAGKEQLLTNLMAPTDPLTNRCSAVKGVVPWSTLAVPETDAWGRRLTYEVSPVFADPTTVGTTWQTLTTTTPASKDNQSPLCVPSPTPQNASFAMCSLGDMAVLTRNDSTHGTSVLGDGLAAVVASHGKNGWGAYTPNGTRYGVGMSGANSDGVPAANTDEAANASATGVICANWPASKCGLAYNQYLYYSRTVTSATSACSDASSGSPFCEFDDIVTWIPTAALISRALSMGRLP